MLTITSQCSILHVGFSQFLVFYVNYIVIWINDDDICENKKTQFVAL